MYEAQIPFGRPLLKNWNCAVINLTEFHNKALRVNQVIKYSTLQGLARCKLSPGRNGMTRLDGSYVPASSGNVSNSLH